MKRNPNLYYVISLLALLTLLSGCQTTGPGRTALPQPICEALVGPIKYNSKNVKSARHAGPALAVDLKIRNRVGYNLKCPTYRR